jgi:7-carboxy-7-deazaguanine synthase
MKPPGSGEVGRNLYDNLALLTARDELKMVILDRRDYEWSRALLASHPNVAERVRAVFFCPAHDQLAPERLAAWIVEDRLPVRLGLQLHKLIWPGAEKGV